MKRIIVRVVVAALTFGFGAVVQRLVTVHRLVISQAALSSEANNDQAVTATSLPASVPACPAATPFPLPAASPRQILLFDYNAAKFNPRGTYYPLHRLPKEFAEFDLFDFAVEASEGQVSGSAAVQTRIDGMYDSQDVDFLLITDRRLFFVTSPHRNSGIAYRFEGEFLSNPALRLDSGRAVVRGTLSKAKDGRTVAQTQATFDVKYLGC